MPKRSSYTEGTPSWVDLQTPDTSAAKAFYGSLFGWSYADTAMPDGSVYSTALLGDDSAAAIAPQSPMLKDAGAPPMWNTYLAVDDVDAATSRATEAGGTVLMAPMQVMEAGKMAFVADPTGAAVGLWQAAAHIGATVVNEPGALIWNELTTTDVDTAAAFYAKVAGLEAQSMDMGGMPYTTFSASGTMVAGATTPMMEGAPNHWHVYFAVASAADTVAKASGLGATVVAEPMTIPIGTMATLQDPQGGYFSVFEPAGPTS